METTIELEQLRTESVSNSSSSEGSSPSSSPRSSPKHLIKKSTITLIKKTSNFDLTDHAEIDYVNPITLLKVHQVVILICSILLMIVLLQIPTILYYANSPSSPSSVGIGFDIDFKTCTGQTEAVSLPSISLSEVCPEVPPLTTQDEAFYQLCLRQSQTLIQSVLAVNSAFNNGQCNSSAVPFFCNATYSLCGDDTYMMDISEECVQVRDGDCPIEWRVLENFFNVPIPGCGSFSEDGNLTFSKAPPLNCSDQFDVFCGSVCLPVCSEFSQISHNAAVTSNALTILFEVIGLIGGVITLIACFSNRKTMYQFPQIYVVYNTVIVIMILIFLILPLSTDYSTFLCSDDNLIEAINTPTGYCQAQGFILHAGILYFLGFWLFHLAHLLFALAYPFKAKRFMEEHSKLSHIVEVIIVLIVGSLPGAVIIGTSQYQINRFPPDLCVSTDYSVFFHTFALPIAIGASIGLCMLFTTFWVLRRNHQLKSARSEEGSARESNPLVTVLKVFCSGFSTPETKLFALFGYYILVIVILLTHFTVLLQTADAIVEQLGNYITCSAAGYKPECEVYSEKLEDASRLTYFLDLASTLLLCSITLSNLTYVLQYYEIKKFLRRFCTSHSK